MDRLPKKISKPIVVMGVFDGVHRAHRNMFEQAIRRAREAGGLSVAYTFDPHPAKVVAPFASPLMLNTISQRRALISSVGIDKIVVQKFTHAFSQQTPAEFFQKTLVRQLKASEIFVGYNFTFGIRRSGTIEHLEEMGRQAGIRIHIVPPFLWKGILVSSTQIRQFLSAGNLPQAEELLGRPYFIEGKVTKGHGRGGNLLGTPTANLKPDNDSILPTGVYVTATEIRGKRYRSLTNIGPNPTFGPGPVSLETHILDGFHQNILGSRLRVDFFQKIREEIRFATAQDLAIQIQNDIKIAQKVFSHLKWGTSCK